MKKGQKKWGIILVFCLMVSSQRCYAEEIPIEKIVVTASRRAENYSDTSREIDVITSQDIEALQAKDLADVLTHFASVVINNYGGPGAAKTLRMRGATASQVLVLVDGRPINSPRDGEVDLSAIPLENIERIEIMRGPASSLYGSSAMGGTVQIITKQPPREGRTTEVSSSFGTFRTYQERLSYGQRMGRFGCLFAGDFQSSEGIRDNTAFNAKDFSTKMEYDITDTQKISVNAGFYKSVVGAAGLITAPDLDDKQKNLKNFIDLNWRLAFDPSAAVAVKIYNNYDRLEFIENTAGSIFDIAFNKYAHTTQARGLDIQFDKQFTDFVRAVAGFNYIINLNNSAASNSPASGKHRYFLYAWYLNNEFNITEDLKVNAGVRVDDYSNFGLQASPSVSALYMIKDKYRIHGLISRSFRAPTFNDLYWPDEGWVRGNPDLKPETGTTGEIGLAVDIAPRVQTDLTYFRSFYSDLIQWAPESPDPFAAWTPTNLSSAVIEGVELENRLSVADNMHIAAGYTYQTAKDDKTGKFLIYQPKHKIAVSIDHKNIFGWTVGIKGEWTSLRFHDAANTVKVDGFFLLGFYASKKWPSGVTCYATINNALNKKYVSVRDYPVPGFTLTSGVKIEF